MNQSNFCEQCGAPLKPMAQFCGKCGHQVITAAPPPSSPPSAQALNAGGVTAPESEPIIGIIRGLERVKGLGTEVFFMVVTPDRLVFAQIPQAMINSAIQQARADAKQRGKGMFGQVAAQMEWMDIVAERYKTIPVDETLAEQPGNFFIPNTQIKQMVFKSIKSDRNNLVIETQSGKHNYMLSGWKSDERLNEARELLRRVLGAVVK